MVPDPKTNFPDGSERQTTKMTKTEMRVYAQKHGKTLSDVREMNRENAEMVAVVGGGNPTLTSKEKHIINDALLIFYKKLTALGKLSVWQIKNWDFYDENGDFDEDFTDVYIDGDKDSHFCRGNFGYNDAQKRLTYISFREEFCSPLNKGLMFPKRQLRNKTTREKLAIWIAQNVFSDFGTEEVLDQFFHESVFGQSHKWIVWDD
jgi:hypothetical protein